MIVLDQGMPVPEGKRVRSAPYTVRTGDGKRTVRTYDSTGAFYVGELERLDQTLHEPLVSVTWGRDIDLREDVTIADEVSSWTLSGYAAPGGEVPTGINWIGKDTDAIAAIALDIGKYANPLLLWGMEVGYTIPELESAMRLGRPVDEQKYNGMTLKHEMDIDQMVFIGDARLGYTGMMNSASITPTTVANGASGSPLWINKTPAEILADVNALLNAAWANSGWTYPPTELRLPPFQYTYILNQLISAAGSQSILSYIRENNLAKANGAELNILPQKWLIGLGTGGTPGTLGTVDRAVAYTRNVDLVRYPMTLLQRTPVEYRSLRHITTYFCRLGVVEWVRPETGGYADGI